jgi:PAS domain-containing protein
MQHHLDKKITQGVFAIVACYVLISSAWILLSDMILVNLFSNINDIRNVAIIKGVLFVLVTALFLFVIISKYAHELSKIHVKLNEDNSRLNVILQMSKQGFYELEISSGKATASAEYWSMLEYDRDRPQLTLEWWRQALHPDDKDLAVATLNRCLNGEISEYRIKYRLKTKSGAWKFIISAGMVVEYNLDGTPEWMVGMHTDLEYLLTV